MIDLEVQDYCHNCPHFEADVENAEVQTYVMRDLIHLRERTVERVEGNTIVRCVNRHKCSSMMKYLEEGKKNDED